MNFRFQAAQGKQSRAFELRAAPDNEFALVGRAVKYNSLSRDLGGFREIIAPGAFSDSIASGEEDIKATAEHNAAHALLGRQANGSLRISDGPDGLLFHCQLNRNLQSHREVYEQVKSGLLSECSFTFGNVVQEWADTKPLPTRTVKKATLYEVAVVSSPAYADGATMAAARSSDAQIAVRAARLADMKAAIEQLRKATRLMARSTDYGKQALGEEGYDRQGDPNGMDPITDQASTINGSVRAGVREHLRFAHELAECAAATCGTVRSILDDYESALAVSNPDSPDYDPADDNYDEELDDSRSAKRGDYSGQKLNEEGYRSFREAFDGTAQSMDTACENFAAARLHHARCFDKKK